MRTIRTSKAHAGTDGDEDVSASGAGGPAANSRKRSAKGQASADVIAFAPSNGPGKKKGAGNPVAHEAG